MDLRWLVERSVTVLPQRRILLPSPSVRAAETVAVRVGEDMMEGNAGERAHAILRLRALQSIMLQRKVFFPHLRCKYCADDLSSLRERRCSCVCALLDIL